MANAEFRMLTEFSRIFEGRRYRHRSSTQGDIVAIQLYEDLVAVACSDKLLARIRRRERVLNSQNRRTGVKARRGDGTFGEILPGESAIDDPGFAVARGPIATVEIGVEVKVLAKAMIKQIDRVINDFRNQAQQFRRGNGRPICVGVVGINQASYYVGYEGRRKFRTTGSGGFLHPFQEAPRAERRLVDEAGPAFDEFLVFRFLATNESPYPFRWANYQATRREYAAALVRISRRYEQRF